MNYLQFEIVSFFTYDCDQKQKKEKEVIKKTYLFQRFTGEGESMDVDIHQEITRSDACGYN